MHGLVVLHMTYSILDRDAWKLIASSTLPITYQDRIQRGTTCMMSVTKFLWLACRTHWTSISDHSWGFKHIDLGSNKAKLPPTWNLWNKQWRAQIWARVAHKLILYRNSKFLIWEQRWASPMVYHEGLRKSSALKTSLLKTTKSHQTWHLFRHTLWAQGKLIPPNVHPFSCPEGRHKLQ